MRIINGLNTMKKHIQRETKKELKRILAIFLLHSSFTMISNMFYFHYINAIDSFALHCIRLVLSLSLFLSMEYTLHSSTPFLTHVIFFHQWERRRSIVVVFLCISWICVQRLHSIIVSQLNSICRYMIRW